MPRQSNASPIKQRTRSLDRSTNTSSKHTYYDQDTTATASLIRRGALINHQNISMSLQSKTISPTIQRRSSLGGSTSSLYTYYDQDITSTGRPSVMKRRGAQVSHTMSPKLVVHQNQSSNRRFQRRFAIYGDERTLRHIKKATHTASPIVYFEPTQTDVIFDEAGDHEENYQFQTILQSFYVDAYQFALTPTHRSIITNTILDELKSSRFKFYVRSYSTTGGYHELDDITALRKIRHQLKNTNQNGFRSSWPRVHDRSMPLVELEEVGERAKSL
jgi:hypothetical protein